MVANFGYLNMNHYLGLFIFGTVFLSTLLSLSSSVPSSLLPPSSLSSSSFTFYLRHFCTMCADILIYIWNNQTMMNVSFSTIALYIDFIRSLSPIKRKWPIRILLCFETHFIREQTVYVHTTHSANSKTIVQQQKSCRRERFTAINAIGKMVMVVAVRGKAENRF